MDVELVKEVPTSSSECEDVRQRRKPPSSRVSNPFRFVEHRVDIRPVSCGSVALAGGSVVRVGVRFHGTPQRSRDCEEYPTAVHQDAECSPEREQDGEQRLGIAKKMTKNLWCHHVCRSLDKEPSPGCAFHEDYNLRGGDRRHNGRKQQSSVPGPRGLAAPGIRRAASHFLREHPNTPRDRG